MLICKSSILFFASAFYILIKSPYTEIYFPKPTIILIAIILSVVIISYYEYKHSKASLLTLLAPFILISVVFIIIAPPIDAVIPSIIYLCAFGPIPILFGLICTKLFQRASTQHTPTTLSSDQASFFSARLTYLLVGIMTLFFIAMGLSGIGKQMIVDEPLWIYDRIERPWHAIARGQLQYARPSDKPGMTISILAGLSLLENPAPSTLQDVATPTELENTVQAMRAPILIFAGLLIPLFFYLLRGLLGTNTAVLATLFLSTSPLLLGMSRIINPDAIFWALLPLTVLACARALQTHHARDMFLTGSLLGLVLLTKYVGTILFVFLPIMICVAAILANHSRDTLKSHFTFFAGAMILGVLVYSILLPSVWITPVHILEGTLWSQAFAPIWIPFIVVLGSIYIDLFLFKKSYLHQLTSVLSSHTKPLLIVTSATIIVPTIFVLITAHTGTLIDYGLALESPKSVIKNVGHIAAFFSGFYVLIFGIHTLVLILALFTLYKLPTIGSVAHRTLLSCLTLLIPFYYIGSTLAGVSATVRYQIVLYPVILILSAYGLTLLLHRLSPLLRNILIILISLTLLHSLFVHRPFYGSYANALLPQGDILFVKDMGDGSYQAAAWINALPNAAELTIWADKQGVCDAFVGACETTISVKDIERDDLSFDYYVTSRGRQKLTIREARRQLRRNYVPQNPLLFEKLYDPQITAAYQMILGNNPANTIKIIDATVVNIHQNAQ